MKIIENRYTPKEIKVTHTGFKHVCKSCLSIVVVEKSDTFIDDYYMSDVYICPCCGSIQNFVRNKKNKEMWVDTIKR